jgi:hypothetical protein
VKLGLRDRQVQQALVDQKASKDPLEQADHLDHPAQLVQLDQQEHQVLLGLQGDLEILVLPDLLDQLDLQETEGTEDPLVAVEQLDQVDPQETEALLGLLVKQVSDDLLERFLLYFIK